MKKIIEIPRDAFEEMYLKGKNVEVEGGEFVQNSEDGSIKEVIGKSHKKGGEKIALPNESRILSDYTKIGAKNIEEFTKLYDIKLKASDTFATVLDKYNKKIGLKELEEEEADLLQKFEKNETSSIDDTTKKINEDFLTQEINHLNRKKEALNKLKEEAFDTIFLEQEKIPKKGDGTKVLDKEGKPLEDKEVYQEGGETGNSAEQIIQAYAQMSGQDPNMVIQQLQEMSPEEQQQAIQQMVVALQQSQPQMKEGGVYNLPKAQEAILPPSNFSFATQYSPIIPGYDVTGNSILNQPILSDVEYMQHYVPGRGYGQKMQDVEKTINTHNWYFDTEEKKKAFREAAMSDNADTQKPVGEFQKAYNEELTQRAKKAGVSQEEIKNLINTVGFTGKGVQQLDSKFGAFTSSRPLFNFNKTPGINVEAPIEPGTDPSKVNRDLIKNVIYDEGMPFLLPPSAPIAPYLQQVNLNRLEGQKGSVENQLQASENARQAAYESTRGLPPAQAAAVMANFLATSGQQDTQGIAAQEMQDLQNKARIEQYNAGQGDKEQILNEQLKKQYEREAFSTLNVNEQNWRNYYDSNEANRQAISDEIKRRNIMNMALTNYQLNGSGGFDFVNQSPFQRQPVMSPAQLAFYNSLTPEKKLEYEKAYALKSGQA